VPGAARYEVEINPSVDFAPGSKVCCTGTTLATSLSPTKVFHDNKYYWRVRAIDLDGNAGVWNYGTPFTKTFDNVPPTTGPAIKNLHLRDNASDPGSDIDAATVGHQTQVPVVTWDAVPGAASYQVDVAPYEASTCHWSAVAANHHWRVTTAVTAWTPLGSGWNGVKPYSDDLPVANDGAISLAVGAYCVRVRARTDRDTGNEDVYGDYTYLDDGTGRGTAFDWTGYPNIVESYKAQPRPLWGIHQIRKKGLRDFGATLSAGDAHSIAIGAETLALRMERTCANAQALAGFLAAHPKVAKVYYPGLPTHAQHALSRSLFRAFGGLFGFELADGIDCFEFLNRLDIVVSSSNLGDNRTLAIPVAHTIFWEMGPARRAEMGIADGLIRVSVGIEDRDDLIADFTAALGRET